MKKSLFGLISILLSVQALSYHIVGGEIEFITIEPGLYRISLIQYRDEAQLNNPNPDESVTVTMFSNRTHETMRTFFLPLVSETDVAYTKPECSISTLRTSRNLYSAEFELDPKLFDHVEGYYIAWERCCRNEGIVNIVNPGGTGMKYILDIPPLYKNGRPFINSSPTLLKPLSDYACVNQLYYTNFTGVDTDGDSLVYRLATPLSVSIVDALPPTFPKTDNVPVTWATGYSLTNMIPGSQPLRISRKGLLTVNPSSPGLYVFSVVVEEWRKGLKIGELQRDFQMMVIGGCQPPDPPVVDISIPGRPLFNPATDILSYTVSEEKCFDFIVTNLTPGERITLRAEAVNFDEDIDSLFSITSSPVGLGQDSLLLRLCAPDCPPTRSAPFIIDLIAGDDACPLPQTDTLRLMLQVQPPANQLPILQPIQNAFFINEDDSISVPFRATDPDGQNLDVTLRPLNFDTLKFRGFSLLVTTEEPGLVEGFITWSTNCIRYDYSDLQLFKLALTVEDADTCAYKDQITEFIDFNVILPENTSPELVSSGASEIDAFLGDTIFFNLEAIDPDGDFVSIVYDDANSNSRLSDLGVVLTFENGPGAASGSFYWATECDQINLLQQDQFIFAFRAEDQDKCKVQNMDFLPVRIQLAERPNTAPYFELEDQQLRAHVNEAIEIPISAFDDDADDLISLSFNPSFLRPNSPSLAFGPVSGQGAVSSTLTWTPECDLLDFGESSHVYSLNFLVRDDKCPVSAFKNLKFTVEVYEDREAFNSFLPPNAFTPNGDGRNDTYSLTNLLGENQNLPQDICGNVFESFTVHDRTGNEIFSSKSRDFVFTGENVPPGVYFYAVTYTKREYKGFIQILR